MPQPCEAQLNEALKFMGDKPFSPKNYDLRGSRGQFYSMGYGGMTEVLAKVEGLRETELAASSAEPQAQGGDGVMKNISTEQKGAADSLEIVSRDFATYNIELGTYNRCMFKHKGNKELQEQCLEPIADYERVTKIWLNAYPQVSLINSAKDQMTTEKNFTVEATLDMQSCKFVSRKAHKGDGTDQPEDQVQRSFNTVKEAVMYLERCDEVPFYSFGYKHQICKNLANR